MTTLPNPFLNSTVSPRAVGSAVASSDLQPRATAAPFDSSCSATDAHQSQQCDVRETKRPETDLGIATELQDREPTSSTGGPQEASAPAPTKNPDADALDLTDCISEIFFYARKLMKQPPRFVLDEAAFMADVEEVPLFIRDGDHLRRQA